METGHRIQQMTIQIHSLPNFLMVNVATDHIDYNSIEELANSHFHLFTIIKATIQLNRRG